MEQWKRISGGRPFLLKGIQSTHDARKAVEMGCDGIVVSNHAGRQVDGAIASLDALEKIVDAVGDRIVITFDSGKHDSEQETAPWISELCGRSSSLQHLAELRGEWPNEEDKLSPLHPSRLLTLLPQL